MFNPVDDKIISALIKIVGTQRVITDTDALENYSHDETPFYKTMPEVVVKPVSTSQVAAILENANRNLIPVTCRGGGTSLSAGAVPVHRGIVLLFELMNHIKEVDRQNLMVTVEPGIITGELDKELTKYGLFFPPDPVSMDSCTIGGNIAECAGGPRAMKYGVTKHYVTGLEVVMSDGTVTKLGGKLIKNVTGYDLIDLIIGSEGTLAVVTEATLRVLPKPKEIVDLLMPFQNIAEASRFSIAVVNDGLMPAAIELMEGEVVRTVEKYLNKKVPYADAGGHVIVEIDGNDRDLIRKNYDQIGELALKMGALDVIVAESAKDREKIWEIRKKVGEAMKALTRIVAREDLVVPKDRIPELIAALKTCVGKYHGTLYAFGHLGDGNIHTDVGIDVGAVHEPPLQELPEIRQMRKEMYEITISVGGTITAEHGIGLSKIDFLSLALDKSTIDKMFKIKKIFDPNNILNPGKIFP